MFKQIEFSGPLRAARGAIAFALPLILSLSSAKSQNQSVPKIPTPSGTYSIGRQAFDLTDMARPDQFSVNRSRHRELMVYIWYPTPRSSSQKPGDYFPGAIEIDKNAEAREQMRNEYGSAWLSIVAGSVNSHAVSDARPAEVSGGFPVVLFSHGVTSTIFSYTTQIEDLASHGYIVVAIDHTDAAGVVLFSDGHLRLFHRGPLPPSNDPLQSMIAGARNEAQTGAEDVLFVLNTLEEHKIGLAHYMDLSRVAAVGHSYGGTLSVRACQLEPRIKACVSEDGEVNPAGAFLDYPDHTSLPRPFMLVEVGRPSPTDAELARMREPRAQWDDYLRRKQRQLAFCVGGSYDVTISTPDMVHGSFSDGMLLNAQLSSGQGSHNVSNFVLIEKIVRGFLDNNLRHRELSIFDTPNRSPTGVLIQPVGKHSSESGQE
jgi:pimeloyl-ACP methyl ester carboxylesterase